MLQAPKKVWLLSVYKIWYTQAAPLEFWGDRCDASLCDERMGRDQSFDRSEFAEWFLKCVHSGCC